MCDEEEKVDADDFKFEETREILNPTLRDDESLYEWKDSEINPRQPTTVDEYQHGGVYGSESTIDELDNNNVLLLQEESDEREYDEKIPHSLASYDLPASFYINNEVEHQSIRNQEESSVFESNYYAFLLEETPDIIDLTKYARLDEFRSMYDKKVWEHVPNTTHINTKVLPSKLVIKNKYNTDGVFTKVKVRLVACGNFQDPGYPYEYYSPTAGIDNIYLTLIVGWQMGMCITAIDVSNAYLNAEMQGDVYMSLKKEYVKDIQSIINIPEDCIRSNGTMIVKLKRALYDCKSSAKLWYEKISAALLSIDFEVNRFDSCIYVKEHNGNLTFVIVYVDDIIILAKDKASHDMVCDKFIESFDKITISCEFGQKVFDYLGMKITLLDDGMTSYINKVVADYDGCRPVERPFTPALLKANEQDVLMTEEGQSTMRSEVAKLLYVAKRNRHDIMLPIVYLSTRVGKYTIQDYMKINMVYDYLYTTKDKTLTLGGYDTLTCYADASHGTLPDCKSIGAFGFTFGIGMFAVSVCKLKIVARSACEAELITADRAAIKTAYFRRFLRDLRVNVTTTRLCQDNQLCDNAVISLIKGSNSQMTRHLNIKQAALKELSDHREIELIKLPTENMNIDYITKTTLSASTFVLQRDKCMGYLPM